MMAPPGIAWLEQSVSWRSHNTLRYIASVFPIELITTSQQIPDVPYAGVHQLPRSSYAFQRAPAFARIVRDLRRANRVELSVAFQCIGFMVRAVPQVHVFGGSFCEQRRVLSGAGQLRSPLRRLVGFAHFSVPEMVSCRRATKVVAETEATKAEAVKHHGRHPDDIYVIPPGVGEDFKAIHSRKRWPTRPRLLFVGRLECLKGIRRLLDEFSRSSRLDCEFLLAGGGPDGPAIAALAERDPRIRLLGWLPRHEIQRVLEETSLFVFPSLYEGLGNAVLEAMASGTPCLAYDAPVFREVLGETGEFAPYDRPDAMVSAIEELAEDTRRLRQLGSAAHERTLPFAWERVAEETVRIITEVLATTRSGQASRATAASSSHEDPECAGDGSR